MHARPTYTSSFLLKGGNTSPPIFPIRSKQERKKKKKNVAQTSQIFALASQTLYRSRGRCKWVLLGGFDTSSLFSFYGRMRNHLKGFIFLLARLQNLNVLLPRKICPKVWETSQYSNKGVVDSEL